jgi:hypothetical protein
MELLSNISEFLGVLRKMAEITTGVFLDRGLTIYDPEIVQICSLIYMFKIVKAVPFAIECKFTVAVNTSQKKFTKSANVRSRADK